MQRYDPSIGNQDYEGDAWATMQAAPFGDYCRYEDASATIVRLTAELAEARAERDAAMCSRQKMHRRAQRSEGKSQRSAALLELIMATLKDALPTLPTLPSPYPVCPYRLFHSICAARDHARNSSGRASAAQWSYYGGMYKKAQARADKAEAERDALIGAAYEAAKGVAVGYQTNALKRCAESEANGQLAADEDEWTASISGSIAHFIRALTPASATAAYTAAIRAAHVAGMREAAGIVVPCNREFDQKPVRIPQPWRNAILAAATAKENGNV